MFCVWPSAGDGSCSEEIVKSFFSVSPKLRRLQVAGFAQCEPMRVRRCDDGDPTLGVLLEPIKQDF